MLRQTILFLFLCQILSGQINDSVLLQGRIDYNFFTKQKVFRIEHHIRHIYNNNSFYSDSDFVIYPYTKTKELKVDFREGGTEFTADLPTETYTPGHLQDINFDKKGNIVKRFGQHYFYDKKNRLSLKTDTVSYDKTTYRVFKYYYKDRKLDAVEELRYRKNTLEETIVDQYYYNTPFDFGYITKHPPEWGKPDEETKYTISNDKNSFSISYYEGNNLTMTETFVINRRR